MRITLSGLFLLALVSPTETVESSVPYVVVLGTAQDGGIPQIGRPDDPAWDDRDSRRLVSSLAVVDPSNDDRWLFEATPDIKFQLNRLDEIAPSQIRSPGLRGVFLTHAHMGHYTGLAQLGHEGLGAQSVAVFAMPRMAAFLRSNGPWDQLVIKANITVRELQAHQPLQAGERIRVTPISVPHRQEYSEVVGYRIEGPGRSVLFIPDIDGWEELDIGGGSIETEIARVDRAYLDGTFFADGEIPGRDMSGFPHPFISHSLDRFSDLPASERVKVRFIHLNHTNPARDPSSSAAAAVKAAGMGVAREMERFELGP